MADATGQIDDRPGRNGDEPSASLTVEPPRTGRIHQHRRRVQLAEVSPRGRLRLDSVARMLQDVSDEDTTEAGLPASQPWVVRRVELRVESFPAFRDTVTATTWCSGIGSRWAERRVRLVGDAGGRIDAAVLWVHLDESGRPARLSEEFLDLYGPAAAGRSVRARLHHGPVDDDASSAAFPLRFTDFDVMDHVNNAVSWEPVEEAMASRPDLRAPVLVSVEHPASIDRGAEPVVRRADRPDGSVELWIIVDGTVCSSALIRPL